MYIGISDDERYEILSAAEATNGNELYIKDLKNKTDFIPVQKGYDFNTDFVDSKGDFIYALTDKNAPNMRLVKFNINKPDVWIDVIPEAENVLTISKGGGYVFAKYMKDAVTSMKQFDFDGKLIRTIDLPGIGTAGGFSGKETEKDLYFSFTNYITPGTIYKFNADSGKSEVYQKPKVKFNPDNYVSEQVFYTSKDGTKIPMSIVYKKGLVKNSKNPLLLYAYGSYGNSIDASFGSTRLSLLNRGFVYAIAHIRGGQEMGRQWYEDGKMMKKMNTFTDFIDCGEYLVKEKYTSPEHLYAEGGSAGGLLMGAIANLKPELWKGVLSHVPFVDVVNTMLDETIPLTTNEYDEWGNPNNKEAYFYMKSYSPYENIAKKNYPNILITTGLHDSQVQYFEPAKWAAKLRDLKTDNNIVLLKTDLSFGHGGASGRFDYLKDIALSYVFMFKLEGITK